MPYVGMMRSLKECRPSLCSQSLFHSRYHFISIPSVSQPMSPYADGKAQAEALVLAGNGSECTDGGLLMTCAVRPSNIFGPGDLMTVPTIVRNAQNGRLKVRVLCVSRRCSVLVFSRARGVSFSCLSHPLTADLLGRAVLVVSGCKRSACAYRRFCRCPFSLWLLQTQDVESDSFLAI